ncbi:MAG: hypothetical protein ICV55_17105 [Coleofasciculus sp. C3-bin4]|nr:hypothetical protein [Coleofasciculus sp. C3-bin4]
MILASPDKNSPSSVWAVADMPWNDAPAVYAKWGVNQDAIALICDRSKCTVQCAFREVLTCLRGRGNDEVDQKHERDESNFEKFHGILMSSFNG